MLLLAFKQSSQHILLYYTPDTARHQILNKPPSPDQTASMTTRAITYSHEDGHFFLLTRSE